MVTEDDWVLRRVKEAQATAPSITAAAAARMAALLRGRLGDHAYRPAELTALAKSLLEDMLSIPPKPEA